MFDQIPNRRITERRSELKDALVAAICLGAGGTEAIRQGRVDWETLIWALVFVLSVVGYWKRRHEDPWNPPDVDGKERHYGALERRRDDKSTRRATKRFLIGNGICAALAAWTSVRWMHSTKPGAPLWAKVWLVLCGVSVLLGMFRILYYRNRRDYFAEEMDHRRSLANDPPSFELKAKS